MSARLQLGTRLNDFWVFPKLSKTHDLRRYDDDYFSFLMQPDPGGRMTQMYIHIPFCDSGCLYCPFYKVLGPGKYAQYATEYVKALIREMKYYSQTPYFRSSKISSVHIGGGNPFLLDLPLLEAIVDSVNRLFNLEMCESWTSEGSIHCLNDIDYVRGLVSMGINRFSFGIQTFKEQIRRKLHIRPTVTEIYRGVDTLNAAAARDYCIDLMYDLPDQGIQDMIQDLAAAASLEPLHIDCYNMWTFPNTTLKRLIDSGEGFGTLPSNENNIRMYEAAVDWFIGRGFYQTTSCTFSKAQKEVHVDDSIYLSNSNVFALGASGRGYLDGYSYRNVCSIDDYLEQTRLGNAPADLGYMSDASEKEDRTMVFFPIMLGIDRESIPNMRRYRSKIDELIQMELVRWDGNRLRVTHKGLVWTGNLSAYFIGDRRWNIYMQTLLNCIREGTNPYNEDYMGTKYA